MAQFHDFEIDDRILKGIAKLGWITPTLIQEKAIPLLLEGKDVLVRARTGSGKTAAFAVPVIQKILTSKLTASCQAVKSLILAPSKELAGQICGVIRDLTVKCSREVRCVDVSPQVDLSTQKPLLIEKPDIVVGTPSRVLKHLEAGNLDLKKSLEVLVIDEADLIFAFGYEKELQKLLTFLPSLHQTCLASATLSDDIQNLKKLCLHNSVTLKLEEPDIAPASQLSHYQLLAEEMDKASILYALLKLHLIRGKTLIFVNTVNKCYKIKLYLEQFGIPTCVLNSELPASIRCHSVNQFNRGVYDILVASDEKALEAPEGGGGGETSSSSKNNDGNRNEDGDNNKKKSKRKKDKESGVSRGIDFQFVANVINFDFPLDVHSYIHRAGRTARGNNQGSVLSFISIKEQPLLKKVETYLQRGLDETAVFKTYQFKLEEVESFRYRAKDAWRAVTKIAIREARLKEIKQEIFNCQKLKTYFEDHPTDFDVLRHDKALYTVKIQPHLADVPDYIVPPTLSGLADVTRKRKRKRVFKGNDKQNKRFKAKNNPLDVNFVMSLGQKNKKKK